MSKRRAVGAEESVAKNVAAFLRVGVQRKEGWFEVIPGSSVYSDGKIVEVTDEMERMRVRECEHGGECGDAEDMIFRIRGVCAWGRAHGGEYAQDVWDAMGIIAGYARIEGIRGCMLELIVRDCICDFHALKFF